MYAKSLLFSCQMALEVKKILEYNHDQKFTKLLFMIYVNTESILEKMQSYDNNPGKIIHIKKNKKKTCRYTDKSGKYGGVAHILCNPRYKLHNQNSCSFAQEIKVRVAYDQSITRELAEGHFFVEGQFKGLEEDTEK